MRKILKPLRDFLDRKSLLPKFSEDTIFLMLIALGVIYFVDPSAQQEIYADLRYSEKAMLIVIVGALFTVYTAFFTRYKTETQKHYMLWFAMIINLVVGVTVIESLSEQGLGPAWYIFPVLNIASFFLVLVFWYTNLYNTERLSTKSMSYENIIYGSIVLVVISQVLKLIPDMNWQVIFSSSIAYATFFSSSVTSFLPKFIPSKGEKIELTSSLVDKATRYALGVINDSGLAGNSLLIVTLDSSKEISIPDGRLSNSDAYISELISERYGRQNVATVMMGYYEWTHAWWSKARNYDALIIDVFLSDEKDRYEFCQIIDDDSDEYRVGEKGLIFLNKQPSNVRS
jgi:hypothetical protein